MQDIAEMRGSGDSAEEEEEGRRRRRILFRILRHGEKMHKMSDRELEVKARLRARRR